MPVKKREFDEPWKNADEILIQAYRYHVDYLGLITRSEEILLVAFPSMRFRFGDFTFEDPGTGEEKPIENLLETDEAGNFSAHEMNRIRMSIKATKKRRKDFFDAHRQKAVLLASMARKSLAKRDETMANISANYAEKYGKDLHVMILCGPRHIISQGRIHDYVVEIDEKIVETLDLLEKGACIVSLRPYYLSMEFIASVSVWVVPDKDFKNTLGVGIVDAVFEEEEKLLSEMIMVDEEEERDVPGIDILGRFVLALKHAGFMPRVVFFSDVINK